jgi:hypothetical protein
MSNVLGARLGNKLKPTVAPTIATAAAIQRARGNLDSFTESMLSPQARYRMLKQLRICQFDRWPPTAIRHPATSKTRLS